MKITIVCDVLGEENNGTTIAAMNLICSLRKKGHQVRVICPDVDKKGVDGYVVVPTYNLGPLNNYVHKNGVTLAKADKKLIELAISDADIVHIMVPFSLGRTAAKLAHEMGIPVSAGFHAMAENLTVHLFMKNSRLANRITYQYYNGLYQYCDAVHYPTQFLRNLNETIFGRTNGYVISNGVNSYIHPQPVERPQAYEDKFVVLFTGRYSGEKSHKVLIDGVNLSKHREKIQLIFAGDGPEKEKIQEYSRKLPLQPVFHFFSREEMCQLLNYADLYVHPAEIEAEGIACLEAMACGLVPVISDSPRCATKEYAIDRKNLFEYDKPADLANKIDYWLEHPEEKELRAKQCIDYAGERFDLDACMDKMEQMLLETAGLAN